MNSIEYKKVSDQEIYQLKENGKTLLEIRYKPELHIARVQTSRERRVLTIENEGLLKIKVTIKNEYGIRIGSLIYDNFSDSHGSVEIEDTRFRFFIQHASVPELHIYKGSRQNLIYSCQLTFDDNNSKEIRSHFASSVIAVSWYLFLKGVNTGIPTFHEAIIL
jgi:hypothetical protein